jgi:hypothetical protein
MEVAAYFDAAPHHGGYAFAAHRPASAFHRAPLESRPHATTLASCRATTARCRRFLWVKRPQAAAPPRQLLFYPEHPKKQLGANGKRSYQIQIVEI